MPTQPVVRPVIRAVVGSVIAALEGLRRWILNFDGMDDRGDAAYRLINIFTDIDLEFKTGPTLGAPTTSRAIIAQCATSTAANREFLLFVSSLNVLGLQVGGVSAAISPQVPLSPNSSYRLLLSGTSLQIWLNGALVVNTTYTRGTAREPSARTTIGAAGTGASTFGFFMNGHLLDVKINGLFYPLATPEAATQLPQPAALGAELLPREVIENPTVKGPQWTYLGEGRWQYIGDGAGSLEFLAPANLPDAAILDYEVESYQLISGAGGMRVSPTLANFFGDRLFYGAGKFRTFYTVKPSRIEFTRNTAGALINCVIKNISLRPLWTAPGSNLLVNGGFDNGTANWNALSAGGFSVTDGQATLTTTAAQQSRVVQELTLEAGAWYVCSGDLVSISGQNFAMLRMSRAAAGSGVTIEEQTLTAPGRFMFLFRSPANDGTIIMRGDWTNAGTIVFDNLSIKKLDHLCNPVQLVGIGSGRWSEINL